MTLRSANLETLCAGNPQLRERHLEGLAAPDGWRVSAARSGEPTVRLGETYLHSRYDPRREAQRLCDQLADAVAQPTALLFYGFGLGYLVEAFAQRLPGLPMVVVEASAEAFAAALEARDLRGLLGKANIRWHVGESPEATLMSVQDLPLAGAQVVRLRPAVEADAVYYRRLDALLQSLLDKREVNANTLQRFGRLWVRNLLANLERFIAHPGIGELSGLFRGVPALLLAAGPSLDELLPHLRRLRERMLIVAVDTSHRFCLREAVEPDLLVSVDPQYWNTRHLDWLPLDRVILVCESAVNPRLFHAPGQTAAYFVSSFFPLGQLLERTIGERGAVGAGGSVSTTAWDVARLVGAAPIYLAGLDLGFPDGRTHARGAFFEERLHTFAGRLSPAEQGIFTYLGEAGPVSLPNNAGGLTLTDRRMLIYKAWFEDQLKQQPPPGSRHASFTLSARGLRIEGLPAASLAECLELPVIRPQLEARLEAAWHRGAPRRPSAEQLTALRRTLRELREELEAVHDLARRAEGICSRLLAAAAPHRDAAAVSQLDRLDRQILSLASRQIAAFLLQPLIGRILDGGAGSYRDVLAVSQALYGEMAASTRYHGGLLDSCLQRLNG